MSENFNFTTDADVIDDYVESPRRAVTLTEPVAPTPMSAPQPLPVLDALNYDFDIVRIEPDAAQRAHLEALAALGQETDDITIEARWRDPRTVTALSHASRAAQNMLREARFGTTVSGVRLPAGHYPAEDAALRHEVVMHLTNLLSDVDATGVDWGAFDCMAFFKANAEAEPIRSAAPPSVPQTSSSFGKRQLALAGLAVGIALLAVAVVAAF